MRLEKPKLDEHTPKNITKILKFLLKNKGGHQ